FKQRQVHRLNIYESDSPRNVCVVASHSLKRLPTYFDYFEENRSKAVELPEASNHLANDSNFLMCCLL
ncbi:MAG: hypothetical protein ACKVHE_29065, partial [Planctomycetales bacterium]